MFPFLTSADGCMITSEPTEIYETNQTALLFFEDGHEDLCLNVYYTGKTDKFTWLVPVPSLPKVEAVDNKIFSELGALANNYYDYYENDALGSSGGVIVYSQEQLGIYNISIVSATGIDGLFSWFEKNKYNISPDNKKILQEYIDKSWYFVLVKLNPEAVFDGAVSKFSQIDKTVNRINFVEKISAYIINAVKNKDYNKIRTLFSSLKEFSKIALGDDKVDTIISSSDEKFQKYFEDNYFKADEDKKREIEFRIKEKIVAAVYDLNSGIKKDLIIDAMKKVDASVNENNYLEKFADMYVAMFSEDDYAHFLKIADIFIYSGQPISSEIDRETLSMLAVWLKEEDISELRENILDEVTVMFTEDNQRLLGSLGSIKISFQAQNAVYPLRVSQISTFSQDDTNKRANSLNLYTISPNRLSADSLKEVSAENIDRGDLVNRSSSYRNFDELWNIFGEKRYWISKFSGELYKEDMVEDIYLKEYNQISPVVSPEEKMPAEKSENVEVMSDDAIMVSLNNREYFRKKLNLSISSDKEDRDFTAYILNFSIENKAELGTKQREPIKIFLSYGVDDNTKALGEGERSAVLKSYYEAFGHWPENDDDYNDLIKIANGRWPNKKSELAEKRAKTQFEKIYKKIADMQDKKDETAITVMAYGLRQKAENRKLESEKRGIDTFRKIYRHNPKSTEEWNIMQAITYSGASRGIDTDGDLLVDEREVKLGTDIHNPDTDKDGYLDGEEVANNYNPKGKGRLK